MKCGECGASAVLRCAVGERPLTCDAILCAKDSCLAQHARSHMTVLGLMPRAPAADTTAAMQRIFEEIAAERRRQIEKFPEEEDGLPDGTGGGGRETWERIARQSCERAAREGTLTNTHIFDEETAEAMAATERPKLREELVQVAAVCVKWVQQIDREAGRAR